MPKLRRTALTLCAVPLTLLLAACGSEADETGATASAEPIDPIAAPAGEWSEQVTRTDEGGWLVGNPDAPIQLVEYGSLTCPACANFSQQASAQLDEYVESGRVNFELRSVLIHGAVDLLLTRMLECASVETAVPLADQLWSDVNAVTQPFQQNQAALEQAMSLPENQRFVAMAETGGVIDFFAARGVSADQARQCLSDSAAIEQLAARSQESATRNEVTGTPTFFLNGTRLDATGWTEVEAALQRAGAR